MRQLGAAGLALKRANEKVMISSEVQRTLVKSPPELWAELSDPAALARHLGELGEIQITRVEPESKVDWTSENTTGSVAIKASGWGTKVTLKVDREIALPAVATQASLEETPMAEPEAEQTQPEPEAEPIQPEIEPALEPEPETTPEAVAEAIVAPKDETTLDGKGELEPKAALEPKAKLAAEPTPEPRRGFFARLFARRKAQAPPREEAPLPAQARATVAESSADPVPVADQPDTFAAIREALEPQTIASMNPFAPPAVAPSTSQTPSSEDPQASIESAGDLAAELLAAEEVAVEEVTAVLAAVLDRLGAAHHRPFSRA